MSLFSGPNDNYVSITLLDSESHGGGKAKKLTRTIEESGANPKWQDGKGETLIFHGIRLQKITLLVRSAAPYEGSPGRLALPCLALPCLALRSCLLQYCDDASDPKPRLKRCHLVTAIREG